MIFDIDKYIDTKPLIYVFKMKIKVVSFQSLYLCIESCTVLYPYNYVRARNGVKLETSYIDKTEKTWKIFWEKEEEEETWKKGPRE
jgi:hypothetical protein